MFKFTVNQKLSTRSICNNDCIFRATVIKRTAKTITIVESNGKEKRCKIHLSGDSEYILPDGRYSMAPTFRANPLFNGE